ncbi:aldo/keto reductase [Rhodobacterales bacterium HKCCE2091]|nr:aldo/keto reductase [Rhodobacterales bacterium HKCCE2091]
MTQTARPAPLALGSWHIFSRLTHQEGMALVRRALDLGITFFDVGDYWDHEESNEEKFRAIVRDLGLRREEYRIGLKVFTNSVQTRAELVRESLGRLGLDHFDYVVCSRPSQQESLETAVEAMSDLVLSGLSERLAVSLWTPGPLRDVMAYADLNGLPKPEFIQLQYNVCRRTLVESEDYRTLFEDTGLKLQAADTLEGGILAGHIARDRFGPEDRDAGRWFTDRNLPRDSGGIRQRIREKVPALNAAAADLGVAPATLAIAYCLLHPHLFNVLFGTTRVADLEKNFAAVSLAAERPDAVRAAVADLTVEGAAAPPLFDKSAGVH